MLLCWRWKFLLKPLGVIFLGVLFGSGPAWAGVPVPPAPPGARAEANAKEIERAWFAHRDFLEKGDWEKCQSELEKIYQWKLDQGIRNHYYYSLALLRESQHAAQRGNFGFVPGLLNYAEKMAPDLSQVSLARAGWFWSQILNSGENGTKTVEAWCEGVWRSFFNLDEALPQITHQSLWVILSFVLTFALFAVSLLLRYHSFLIHHLKHLIRLEMSSILRWALSFLILFSPFFLGLGWMWVMALWVLVFWAYGGRADRTVSLVLLLLLLLLPTGIRHYSSLLFSLSNNGVPEILRANTGVWDGELYQKLLAMSEGTPPDPDVLQATGLVEKRMGKFREAEQRFLQMAQMDSRAGSALNNLGNIYLATNRPEQAMEAYRKAIQLEPSREEAYYNLGQAYLLKLRMKEADAEFEKAKSLAPGLVSYYTSISSRNFNRLVIDRTIDPVRVWQRIVTLPGERDRIAGALWGILFGGISLEHGEIALGALFLLLGAVHLVARGLPFIRHCDRCGQLICSRCTRSRVMGTQCVQCLHAFTMNPSADPKVVKKKRNEAARYQTWLVSFPQRISLFIPGFGHLFLDRGKEGVLYLFIATLFLTKVLLWAGQLPSPLALNPAPSYPWVGITAVLFFLFYGFVQYRMKKVRIQGGKSHFRRA